MHFDSPTLQQALVDWRGMIRADDRAEADNLWFEERVSAERRRAFEAAATDVRDPATFKRRHIDYFRDFVATDRVPHTFTAEYNPADLGPIDEDQRIVRLESLTTPLRAQSLTLAQLQEAAANGWNDVIDGFLDEWNRSRDHRPAFAAFRGEVFGEVTDDAEWANRLRDRLGLAHYDCTKGPEPVALMGYTVREVLRQAARAGPGCTFTSPTVLDTGPWPYFYPAPAQIRCGRTMSLFQVKDDSELFCEILHVRLTFRRQHIVRLGEITRPVPDFDLKALRNHHLLALQIASGRDDFGEEMP
jgi:hypothetical protein